MGLLLEGRYRLEQRRARDGASSTWDGSDDQLSRPVTVQVVTGRTAAAVVDAARRCAAFDDERLSRVLDVGTSQAGDGGALGWVVSEHTGGLSLAELLRAAPMGAARVRAVVGEAATALARAAASGLHHRRLDPSSVLVTERGEVLVTGVEVAAAASGTEPTSDELAEHEDAIGLVSLLYAGLTGLWPHGRFSALGAAPLAGGIPVPPGDLVAGVPSDLDELVTATLGPWDEGPRSPAEVVELLAPWGSAASWAGTAMDPDAGLGAPTGASATAGIDFDALGETALHQPVFADPGLRAPRSGSSRSSGAGGDRDAWPEGWSSATPDDAAAWDGEDLARAPGGSGGPGDGWEDERPVRRGGGRVVLALVAVAVVALLVVAGANLHRITRVFSGTSTSSSPEPSASSPGPSSSAAPSGAASATPSSSAAAGVTIASARALDPLGDGSENDQEAPRAIDGDPTTAWTSSTYKTAAFGGLKTGLGLALDLARTTTVRSVDVEVAGTGGVLQVRSSADGSFAATDPVLATATVGSGTGQSVHIALDRPTTTRHLVLWFTRLPSTSSGYSAQVADVAVH